MREDLLGGGVGIGALVPDVAAILVEEAVDVRVGVMEAPRTRPAVGAGVESGVAVRRLDALQLGRRHVQRLVPRHRHARLPAPARGRESVGEGKSVSGSVSTGGSPAPKKNNK